MADEKGRILKRWRLPAVRWTQLAAALRQLKLGKLDRLTAGATGVWSGGDRRALGRSLRGLAREVRALSDVELAHAAAFGGGPGILVIAGTGSIAFGKNRKGEKGRAGGLGALLGDEGSGFWIGREALREPKLGKFFPENLALKLTHDPKPIRAIASLTPQVFRLASRNRSALRITREAGRHLGKLALTLSKSLRLPNSAPVSLHGSVFKNKILLRSFQSYTGRRFVLLRRHHARKSTPQKAPDPQLWAPRSQRNLLTPVSLRRYNGQMKIALGADHAGFELKHQLQAILEKQGHTVLNMGTDSAEAVDYPDYAKKVALAVVNGKAERGIMVCGSGVGACVAANKVPGARAGLCHDTFSAHQGVEDDDVNVLCLGARVVGCSLAAEIVKIWLAARFSNADRHRRRRDKVIALETEFSGGK